MDSGEEVTFSFVIARHDSAEVLKLEEEVLDEMSVLIPFSVIGTGCKPVGFRWDNGLGSFSLEAVEHPRLSVVGFIGEQVVRVDLG